MDSERYLYIINTSDELNNVILGHAEFAKEAGFIPIFVFPWRNGGGRFNDYGNYATLRLNFVFKNTSPLSYLISILKFIFFTTKMLIFKTNVRYVLAVDLTGVLASAFLKIRGCKIYTLVNDNFAARYKLPGFFSWILQKFETGVYKLLSSHCIFPDVSRHRLLGSPNIGPVSYLPNVLKTLKSPRYKGNQGEKLMVLFCGWLVESRGVELIPRLLEITHPNVEFVLVGAGSDDLLQVLRESSRVKVMNAVVREECLNIMSNIDINFAFYNPSIPINRVALPQKVYDSILVGCPIFINSEVAMADSLVMTGGCLRAPYFDIKDIADQLTSLAESKEILHTMATSLWMSEYREKTIDYELVRCQGVKMYSEFLDASIDH